MPGEDESKSRWIESISKHQSVHTSDFMICERHFESDVFVNTNEKKKKLKKEAVPSIFDKEPVHLPLAGTSHTKNTAQSGRNRYCYIKNCHNENGTRNKNILFFR